MELRDNMTDIVERLNAGVHEEGMHDDNSTSLFDIDDANEAMCEAADTITTLRAERDALREGLGMALAAIDDHNASRWGTGLSRICDYTPMTPIGAAITSLSKARALLETNHAK